MWKLDDATLDGSSLTTDEFSVEPWMQRLKFSKGGIEDLERFCQTHSIVFKDTAKRKATSL
jgi:hypothetical protein